MGSAGGFERPLIQASPVKFSRYAEVQAGPINGVGVLRAAVSLVKLMVGTVQSLGFMLRRRPDAVLMTGGWVCVPEGVAAWLLRVPSMIYLPDIEPGLTIKALRYLATKVAVTAPDSYVFFRKGQATATGYPVRKSLLDATREAGQARFKLDPARKTLLVSGGSRGARSINRALLDILPQLLEDGIQVIHITGTLDWDEVCARLKALGIAADGQCQAEQYQAGQYQAFAYLHDDMALALACADLAVGRSGASALGELTLFGLPSILVPYPFAWRYQKVNADYLVRHGAGLLLEDGSMGEKLLPTIRQVLGDERVQQQMKQAAAALAQPEGASNAARELIRLTDLRKEGR